VLVVAMARVGPLCKLLERRLPDQKKSPAVNAAYHLRADGSKPLGKWLKRAVRHISIRD